MTTYLDSSKHPHLVYLAEKRRERKLEYLDIPVLRLEAGSQDQEAARKAIRTLTTKWNIEPDKDAINAQTIDIMEQMKDYSEREIDILFDNLVGIQLTEGCNGNCSFCLFGKKKGVDAKYSFESIATFIRTYADKLKDLTSLYWDSDPFDYKDGTRSFLDVYKVWREVRSGDYQYVSTALPRGGADDFIGFMRYAIREQSVYPERRDKTLAVRISLAQHNLQRTEATFTRLTEVLLKDGYTREAINSFYNDCVIMSERFDYKVIGPLIKSHDDIKDVASPACRDGVVISPRSVSSIAVTAPTMYEPSGQVTLSVSPGSVEKLVPRRMDIEDYSDFEHDNSLPVRVEYKQLMIPRISTHDRKEYDLPNEADNLVLKLGREVTAIGRLLDDLAGITLERNVVNKPQHLRDSFLKLVPDVWMQRSMRTMLIIRNANAFLDETQIAPAEREKLQFYILLAETYYTQMKFVCRAIEKGLSLDAVSAIAQALRNVSKDEVNKLPEIIGNLRALSAAGPHEPSIKREAFQALEENYSLDRQKDSVPEWFLRLKRIFIGQSS